MSTRTGPPQPPVRPALLAVGAVAAAATLLRPWLPQTEFVARAPLVLVVVVIASMSIFYAGRRRQWHEDRLRVARYRSDTPRMARRA